MSLTTMECQTGTEVQNDAIWNAVNWKETPSISCDMHIIYAKCKKILKLKKSSTNIGYFQALKTDSHGFDAKSCARTTATVLTRSLTWMDFVIERKCSARICSITKCTQCLTDAFLSYPLVSIWLKWLNEIHSKKVSMVCDFLWSKSIWMKKWETKILLDKFRFLFQIDRSISNCFKWKL